MARNFNELRGRMSAQRREANEQAVQDELASMLLKEIRRLAGLTQEEVADSMGITQSALSRLESQDDMYVSTLQRIVESLGGKLEIIADMPDGKRVSVSQFRRSA
jgi:transcriptional regulator with XRE-family HTH domain